MKNTQSQNDKNILFKFPIWKDKRLTTNHIRPLMRLYYLKTIKKESDLIVSLDKLSENCGLKQNKGYISKLMKDLETWGYIRKYSRQHTYTGLNIASEYEIIDYQGSLDCYVLLSTDLFVLPISSKDIALYIYLCTKGMTGEAFPSLEEIRSETGLSKSTIVKSVKHLQNVRLIAFHHYKKQSGRYGRNRYYIISKISWLIGKENITSFNNFIFNIKEATFKELQYIKKIICGNESIPIIELSKKDSSFKKLFSSLGSFFKHKFKQVISIFKSDSPYFTT